MSQDETVEHIAIDGESLWTTKVEPSTEGSGALPPNPTFSEETPPTPPEIEKLLKAFSTPTAGDFELLNLHFP